VLGGGQFTGLDPSPGRQQQIGDGIAEDYTTWSRGGRTMMGRLQMNRDWAAPDTGAHWLLHFAVHPRTGTDAAVERGGYPPA